MNVFDKRLKFEVALDYVFQTLGQIGRVTEICINNIVEVTVHGKVFLYHPLCLLPASGDSLQEELGSQGIVLY